MKSVRKVALTTLLSVGAISALTFTSCKKSDDSCAAGYEGSDCKTLSITKFVKTWSCVDKDASGNIVPTYSSIILPSSTTTVTDLKVSNFSNLFTNDVNATLSSSTSIDIAKQSPDNDGYYVSGSATYSSGKLMWNYTLTNPSNATVSYTGTWQ